MKNSLFHSKNTLPIFIASFYLVVIHFLMGLRPEHLLLVIFLLSCYFIHSKSRRFAVDFLPVALFGILYDFLRIFPKSWAGQIHVEWPYQLERFLFGFYDHGEKIIPSDFFVQNHWMTLDFLTGVAYSLHVIVPVVFAFMTWLKNPGFIKKFNQTFFLVNLMAFITYVVLPVAPPWYVEQYGFQAADWGILPGPAGLVHFDAIIGRPYFHNIYSENAWVFGAIPSMHAGFPFLVFMHARQVSSKTVTALLATFMLFVWFSAVYLQHHYIIDLIAGVLYVLAAMGLHRILVRKVPQLS